MRITFNKKEMKINNIIFAFIIFSGMIFSSCDSFLDPMPEQRLTEENIIENPSFAEGFLLRAYKNMPTGYDFVLDVAADDAVNNKPGSGVNTMVTGGWTSTTNLTNQWGKSYEMFYYIHKFMEIAPKVEWDWRLNLRDSLFTVRLIGEAYALRAYWGFELLKAHGGLVGSQLLGYPIVTKVLGVNDNLQLPRNTYAECVKQIVKDLDSAIVRLPLKWEDKIVPPPPANNLKYIHPNAIYNETMGAKFTNRINGITAKHLKARVLLYASSPAFAASGYTWTQAAEAAAAVMVDNGGLVNITAAKVTDLEFYTNFASKEIIWASSKSINQTGWAKSNYPPSLFGSGETNPTQNFVESFPMIDGKPYVNDSSISVNQYRNRDPRLAKYVVCNGMTFSGVVMKFADDAANINAPGKSENATLSGYYLKKFINETIKIDPAKPTVGADQFYTYARYTETLLNFAEAANEAVGPDGVISTYTARGVINAIRTRAGITSTAYINGLDKDGLREAIKNERRIELCFEGHRFWDIRRWNDLTTMKKSVSGVKFNAANTAATVSDIQVRDYKDYMIYCPIPYSETLKYDLKQNNGWQ